MYLLRPSRIVDVSIWQAGAVLSGCAHNSPSEVAKDIAQATAIGAAKAVYVEDCVHVPGRWHSSCEQEFENNVKLGQSVYGEFSPDGDNTDASRLSEELDAFIERRRAPERHREDSSDEVPSP